MVWASLASLHMEFIIDLIRIYGTLITTKTPSIVSIHNPIIDNLSTGQPILTQAIQNLCSILEERRRNFILNQPCVVFLSLHKDYMFLRVVFPLIHIYLLASVHRKVPFSFHNYQICIIPIRSNSSSKIHASK